MIMSIEYRVPADMPQDPNEIDPEWAADQIREVRKVRRTRNISIPRFVRALNASGYEIDVEEYHVLEGAPKTQAILHVREYILTHCERALDKKRVIGSVQTESTANAMYALMHARTNQGHGYEYMAEELTKRGIPVSTAQYRTAEQGITRNVPFDLIDGACDILGIRLGEWKE
jgi:hypothetical protein